MDLSKLPKLSETPAPPQVDRAAERRDEVERYLARYDAPGSSAAEAWISIAIGAILLLMSPRLLQYMFSPGTFSEKWTFSNPDGSPLAYPKTVFFWGDVALVAFALVLIVEGVVLVIGRKHIAVVVFAFCLTVAATLFNLGYVVVMLQMGYGPQIFSLLAVAFGGYIAFYEWNLLQSLRMLHKAASARA
jgi:hypothetical protein